jgi:hypothetical protein
MSHVIFKFAQFAVYYVSAPMIAASWSDWWEAMSTVAECPHRPACDLF